MIVRRPINAEPLRVYHLRDNVLYDNPQLRREE
jgi:hypothetical protein